MENTTMIERIIKWSHLIEFEPDFSAQRITFLKDFGPWSKGQYCDEIRIDFMQGLMTEHNREGVVLQKCFIEFVPVRES